MSYSIDGTATSMGPHTVLWRPVETGVDHNGAPIYSTNYEVDLSFPPASPTFTREWTDLVDGASHTVITLGRDELTFVTLSPVYARYTQPPAWTDINATEFVITLLRAKDNL